jgi:hypothetical protein
MIPTAHNNAVYVFTLCMAAILCACHNNDKEVKLNTGSSNKTNAVTSIKVAGSFQDTLIISSPSAVFYYPDSLQLLKIKAQTEPAIYEGLVHEYFFQMRNAHIVIKKTWPALNIIDSRRYRYLLFIKANGKKNCIDLDKKKEPFGLIVFNGKKTAQAIDMSNAETGISFYLKE